MSFTRQDLSDMNKLWGDSADGGPDQAEVPEGLYQARVVSAELMKSGSGRPQCKWVYKIVGGADGVIGKSLITYDGLENPMGMGFFKKKLKRLGLAIPADFEEIPELLGQAVGAVVAVQVKYKDDFLNVYLNKLVKAGTGEVSEEDADDAGKKPAKGAKKSAEDDAEEQEEEDAEEDDKPAKGATKKPAEDAEEGEEKEGAAEEDEETEEKEEEEAAPARNFPTLAEIDKTPAKGVRKVLKEFKLDPAADKKESTLRAVAKVLVAIMEDDAYDAPAGDVRVACKWLGVKPEDDQSVKKMTRQLIKKLGG